MYKTKDGLTYELVVEWIEAGRVVIANVLEGHHFVLSVGGSEDGDTIEVHDPGDLASLTQAAYHPTTRPPIQPIALLTHQPTNPPCYAATCDEGFDTANYSYTDDILGFRIFDMS